MFKKIIFMCIAAIAVSCSSNTEEILPDPDWHPTDSVIVKDPKPKAMWITAYDVNFRNLNNETAVKTYLARCKDIGITFVYMDAVAATGYALADVPSLKKSDEVNWDLFGCVLNVCDSLELGLVANISPLCIGRANSKVGVAFDSDEWNGKTQCKKVMLDGENYIIVDSKDDTETDAVMLDPSVPEAREYAAKICRELALACKDHKCFKGISLDYVRYSNADEKGNWYGYGPVEENFQKEIGPRIKDFNYTDANDFINAGGGFGKYFTEWVYYRANSVTKTIRRIREEVKAAVPECELHLWASAQWSSRYSVGQNWASKNYTPVSSKAYIDDDESGLHYKDTGFAEELDVFILGAYASDIYINDNPNSDWTVENFVKSYTTYIPVGNPCKVYGSIAAYAYNDNATKEKKMIDATYLCLVHTDGYMVFELGHVTNLTHWKAIKEGIQKSGY